MSDLPPFDILGKLMITRELSFGNGRITLFGDRMVLPPARIFSEYIRLSKNSQESAKLLYESARISFREGLGKGSGRKFGFDINEFFKWMPSIGSMAGWGKVIPKEFFPEKNYAVVLLEDSPIVADLKGIIKGPVDHVMAGFITGAVEASTNSLNAQTVEEECAVDGAPACKFVVHGVKK